MSPIQVKKTHTLWGHRDAVYTLEPTPNASRFFSGAGDCMIVLWDLNNTEEGELIARLNNSIYTLHLLKNNLLVAGHNYEGIHLLDWQTKKEVSSLQLTTAAIFDIKSFGNDLWVATGDGTLIVVDILSLTIKTKIKVSEKSARVIAIHPHSHEIAVGYSDHIIRFFEANTYQLKHTVAAHLNSVFALQYLPTGGLLSASRDARLKKWNDQTYDFELEVAAHLFAINDIALSPNGKYFATASMDKSIKIWDTEKMQLLKVIDKARHAGHGTSVNKLWWSSFNNQLISASDDRSISVWEIEGLQR